MVLKEKEYCLYRSLANATTKTLWLTSLLRELRVKHNRVPIIQCNTSVISMLGNPMLLSRTKHIGINLYFVREKVMNNEICVQQVPAIDQISDILTKALSTNFFNTLRNMLGVKSLTMFELRGSVRENE